MSDSTSGKRFRFGVFEADTGTGELRKQGLRVKLKAQPFQVLCLLLQRPGELLTRDEISTQLWPDGTFVDFDHGVNSAVNRIREALGDSATNPRFVETLARRGYRFIAPVILIADEPQARAEAVPETPISQPISVSEPPAVRTRRILSSPEELPTASLPVVQALFVLLQAMYLGFYIGALANAAEIANLLTELRLPAGTFQAVVVSAAILIPVRAFLICAVLFQPPGLQQKFLKLWPFLVAADCLWSMAPFLLLHHINMGVALSCTALLVYSPFVQRSLILMGSRSDTTQAHTPELL